MPDLSSVSTTTSGPSSTQWYPDRQAPASFGNVSSYGGRSNVLQESVSPNDYNSNDFYNTQGMKIDVNQAGPATFLTDVYIDNSWASNQSGNRRTDLWGTMVDGGNQVTAYPIIGFTNQDGVGTFRFWDSQAGVWTSIANPINYDGWNQVGFSWDGFSNSVDYWFNGANVGSAGIDPGTTEFANVMIQTKNFGGEGYSSYYSNTTTPEPSSMALLGTGLVGLVPMIRRRIKR